MSQWLSPCTSQLPKDIPYISMLCTSFKVSVIFTIPLMGIFKYLNLRIQLYSPCVSSQRYTVCVLCASLSTHVYRVWYFWIIYAYSKFCSRTDVYIYTMLLTLLLFIFFGSVSYIHFEFNDTLHFRTLTIGENFANDMPMLLLWLSISNKWQAVFDASLIRSKEGKTASLFRFVHEKNE